MIEGTASTKLDDRLWRGVEAKLRPFIAKRVGAQSDVDDVLQEVFVRIQRGLPTLRDGQRFGPWVYRVARNALVDHLRAVARHPLPAPGPLEQACVGDAPAVADMSDEDQRALQREVAAYAATLIAVLPSPYREALTLTELQGLSQVDAAQMLGISVSGMKSRVQRGRKQLREALEACCDIALDARRRVVACQPRIIGEAPDCSCTTGPEKRA